MSILSRGSIEEKIEWIFRLYDIHSAGQITKDELNNVVQSIYDMMGPENSLDSQIISNHVREVFEVSGKTDNDDDFSFVRSFSIKKFSPALLYPRIYLENG